MSLYHFVQFGQPEQEGSEDELHFGGKKKANRRCRICFLTCQNVVRRSYHGINTTWTIAATDFKGNHIRPQFFNGQVGGSGGS